MIDLWRCEVCNCTKEETPKNYIKSRNKFKKNLCNKHYIQLNRHGKIKDANPSHLNLDRVCSFCGSRKKVQYVFKVGSMLCAKHRDQLKYQGKMFKRTMFDKNEIIIKKHHAEIMLYDKNHICIAQALIDLDDVETARQYKWCLSSGYVITGNESLHRIIMSKSNDIEGEIIDHIDRDPLNNKKENLRITCKSMNAINAGLRTSNTSGVTGVSYIKATNKWRAYINYKGERIELGHINDKEKAIKERLMAELNFYGDDAPQKHLFKEYEIEQGVSL